MALDQSEVHANEEKCKVQVYVMVTILRMEGKKAILRKYSTILIRTLSQSKGVELENGLV